MMVRPVCLDAGDAVELGELLVFLVDWLGGDVGEVADSLSVFVGGGGYDIDGLRTDLARFVFLLGGDGEMLFGGGVR